MSRKPKREITDAAVFWAVLVITVICGVGAIATGIAPYYLVSRAVETNMSALFSTFSHLFSAGVGAFLALLAARGQGGGRA